jgi:hypothetical protein
VPPLLGTPIPKQKMKTKYTAVILVVAFGLALMSFANEQQPTKVQKQTIRIKSHGETVAELKVSTKTPLQIRGGGITFNSKTSTMTFMSPVKGGITVRINDPGELPITLKADEVELVLEREQPALLAE